MAQRQVELKNFCLMKNSRFSLSNEWNALMVDSLIRLTELIQPCKKLNQLVHIVNCILAVANKFAPQATDVLELCQIRLAALISVCDDVNALVRTAKAVARVVKLPQPEWEPLLDACAVRLRTIVPLCNAPDAIVRALNCMTRIAPLIGTPIAQENDDACEAAAEQSAEHAAETTPQAVDADQTIADDTQDETPCNLDNLTAMDDEELFRILVNDDAESTANELAESGNADDIAILDSESLFGTAAKTDATPFATNESPLWGNCLSAIPNPESDDDLSRINQMCQRLEQMNQEIRRAAKCV